MRNYSTFICREKQECDKPRLGSSSGSHLKITQISRKDPHIKLTKDFLNCFYQMLVHRSKFGMPIEEIRVRTYKNDMENPKFEIFRYENDNKYYFRLIAKNGEHVLISKGFGSKQLCKEGIASVKANAFFNDRYDRKSSLYGEYYFILKSGNGEELGESIKYPNIHAQEEGIKVVISDALDASIEENIDNEWKI